MTKHKLKFQVLDKEFTIHQFPPDHPVPPQLFQTPFYTICRTRDELSIVCGADTGIDSETSEKEWSCIQVAGQLDFALTGILADISGALAKAGISLFAISTFDTDYILVKTTNLKSACRALTDAGHIFI